tara:strand:+ start:280 stop:564 length:285 start_codon:yes stop_codon:yes gene_type:complete
MKGNKMIYNFYTKEAYSEKNREILEKTGKDGGFLTFNQARKLGGKVRKGEKSIARLSRFVNEEYNKKKKEFENGFRSYCVFHVSQVDFTENKDA